MWFQDVSRPSELTAPAESAELFIVRFEIATSKDMAIEATKVVKLNIACCSFNIPRYSQIKSK